MAVLAALLGLAVGGGLVLLWSEFTSPESSTSEPGTRAAAPAAGGAPGHRQPKR